MAHKEQINFCKSVKEQFPQFFRGVTVLDIGSLDINGNNHYLFEDYSYIGVDLGEGRNVDVVSRGHEYKSDERYDVVVSTECFEHDEYWKETILNVIKHLRNGGLFLFTCATEGRPEHGTKRTSPQNAPFVGDYYRNLTEDIIMAEINFDEYFSKYKFSSRQNPADLYFWGIKK
jgi:SAM-dependent methyltransferase